MSAPPPINEPIDIRAERNAAQLAALSALVGAMLGVLRAKGGLSHAELEAIFGAADGAAAADDPAAAQLVATVKALMIGVGDRRYRGAGFAEPAFPMLAAAAANGAARMAALGDELKRLAGARRGPRRAKGGT